ncbi:MAG TPA: CbiX/SirB N-terminal domain-containing protein [Longimicrobiales bacterium]|nr:CbiX/SirB N-terminal domain-containing protein [Longimicrobiales bacterium]
MKKRIWRALVTAAGTLCIGALAVSAQERIGTVIVAHGASDEWNAPILEVAALASTGGPVEVSFLMGPAAAAHRFQDAVAGLVEHGVERVVVVPLLVSSHSGHYEQIRYLAGGRPDLDETMLHHLHAAGIERPSTEVPIAITPALDAAPEMADILSRRVLELAESPRDQAVFIVGHGPNGAEEHAAWMSNLREVAAEVARGTGVRDVKVGLVRDDAPAPVRAEAVRGIRDVIELQHEVTGRDVVVVPVLISSGSISRDKLPADLEGLPIVYEAQPLLPDPAIARWIERSVREAAGQD